jgi:competence protein ComEA
MKKVKIKIANCKLCSKFKSESGDIDHNAKIQFNPFFKRGFYHDRSYKESTMNMKSIIFSMICTCGAFGLHAAVNSPATNLAIPAKAAVVDAKATAQQLVSINQASQQQLEAIPGIGAKKAQAIMEYIKDKGPIKNQKQLTEVKGIGEKMAAKIASFVSFS